MLPILLTILKIIGIVILIILGLVLIVLLLVLLVPVRYSLSGSYGSGIKVKAKVTWLLHAISLGITYEDKLDIAVRFLGKRLFQKKENKSEAIGHLKEMSEDFEEELEEMREDFEEETEEMPEGFGEETESAEEDRELEICGLTPRDSEEDEALEGHFISDEESVFRSRKSKRKKKPKKEHENSDKKRLCLSERIKGLIKSFKEKRNRISDYKDRITAFVTDKENQKTFRLIWRQFKIMVRHILPTKVRGRLAFGFDNPCTTGNVLAGLSILYAWYGDAIQITPVFDENILEGEGSLKGRIRAGTLLVLLIRIVLNKNFRVLVKRWRRNGGI